MKRTYEELVEKSRMEESRQVRYQIRKIAFKLYPDKYQNKDFSKNIYKHASYEDLCEFFKTSDKPDIKSRCKNIAMTKFYPIYKDSDFPRAKVNRNNSQTEFSSSEPVKSDV